MKLLTRIALLLLCIVTWSVLTSPTLWAAGVVGSGSQSSCDSNRLQEALTGGGEVTFNCGADPHTIAAGTYLISEDTTIFGANLITLNGEDLRQLFLVQADATLTLHDIILLDGNASTGGCIATDINSVLITENVEFRSCHNPSTSLGGGAIYNLGTFTATDTLFFENRAEDEGGAILNRGTFYTERVVFEANTAADDSGAIENDQDGIAYITDSIFLGNIAEGAGGAIGNTLSFPNTEGSFNIERSLFVDNQSATIGGAINNVTGNIIIVNSTFVRNSSDEGGAIYSTANTLTSIRFSTFIDNRADTGGAIYRPLTGVIELGFSILAGSRNQTNTQDRPECDGPSVSSLGYNLIEDGTCVDGNNATDIRNTTPDLAPLANNGGFSMTQMPNANSPALGKVPAAQCLPDDQRLARRSGDCDIGATELGGLFVSAYMPRVRK